MSSFYSPEELPNLGFGKIGKNVLISKNANFYNPQNIFLSDNVRIDDFCILSAGSRISIGSYVHISAFVALFGGSGIKIGNFCSISSFSAIYSESDDFSGNSLVNPWFSREFKPGYKAGCITMENFSIIGANCTLMPGISLGEGTAIGSNSLVNADCEGWNIYLGIPAKRIRKRSKKILDLLKDHNEAGLGKI